MLSHASGTPWVCVRYVSGTGKVGPVSRVFASVFELVTCLQATSNSNTQSDQLLVKWGDLRLNQFDHGGQLVGASCAQERSIKAVSNLIRDGL